MMMMPKHTLLLLGLLLTGCNLNIVSEPEPIYVIVTAAPTESGVDAPAVAATPGEVAQVEPTPPPPTVPPEPTTPPTATVPPDQALVAANRFMLNGFYEDAVEHYRSLLNPGVPEATRATAAFRLGEAALREGLFVDAVNALTDFIDNFPPDEHTAHAYFLRGDANLGLGRWNEAIVDFQQYLALKPGLIDSYAYERIGDAQLALGQTAEALNSYTQAANTSRSLVPQLQMRERLATVNISIGNVDAALEQYDAILNVARNAPYRAAIEFYSAEALLNGGRTAEALDRMQLIFDTYPDTVEAYAAMLALLNNERPVDPLVAANVYFRQGEYQAVIDTLNQYTITNTLDAVPAELHLLLGRAYRELGNADAAVIAFQTVIDQYPQDPAFGEALLEQGRTRFLAGDIPGAIERYTAIADNFGYLPEAAEALWRVGFLYGTNENPQAAQQVFERLADEYPGTEQAVSGLFLAASTAFSAGDFATAERLYGRIAINTTGEDQAAAYLNAGRLALETNNAPRAPEMLQQAITLAPDSYYAARAQDLLNGRAAFAPPAERRFEFDDAADIVVAEEWLRATFGITQEGSLWQLAPDIAADARLQRGRELWAVAAYDEARAEFGDVLETYHDNPLASYQLAVFLRGLGAYQSSVVGAANVIRAAGVATVDAPGFVARMRYPVYYREVVLPVAEQYGFDPLLMFALIRHESLFDTNADGGAAEKGLTQVIPSTAEYIAQQIDWSDYQHSDLYRPYAGVAFGAFYLDEQLERFDQNAVAALAGYNAGPGRAINWLQLSGGDPDLFITAITIDSTRLYVQRIYSYYTIYRALYGV